MRGGDKETTTTESSTAIQGLGMSECLCFVPVKQHQEKLLLNVFSNGNR